jgi:hypothetical protein
MDFITVLTVAQYATLTACSILGAVWTIIMLSVCKRQVPND